MADVCGDSEGSFEEIVEALEQEIEESNEYICVSFPFQA